MTCLPYSAATFKHRVTLQEVSRVSDGQGGYTETWEDTLTLWARVEPMKGWERLQALQLDTQGTHKVTIRYTARATTATRMLFQGRVFDIKEVINPEEANAFLRLMCVETARIDIASPWQTIPANWEDIDELWGPSHGLDSLTDDWNDLNTNWENMA